LGVRLADDGPQTPKTPLSVSPDGKFVLYARVSAETGHDIWMLSLDGSAKARAFVSTPFNERWAQFSPDGRWVTYMSEESGTRQIYIRAFPSGAQQLRVSPKAVTTRGGAAASLFFYYNGKMMAAAVQADERSVEITSVTPLFDCRPPEGFSRQFYDVTPDGRFLMMASEGDPWANAVDAHRQLARAPARTTMTSIRNPIAIRGFPLAIRHHSFVICGEMLASRILASASVHVSWTGSFAYRSAAA
jgi:hypothetical protein